jgi:diguanylate cyclase (GGDEF)-like protein
MTLAAKISTLFIVAALLLIIPLATFSGQREYRIVLQHLVEQSRAQVLSRPDLQVLVYQRDAAALAAGLQDFFDPPAVSLAAVYDSEGELLVQRGRTGDADYRLPLFKQLRRNLAVAEFGLVALGPSGDEADTGLWSSLTDRDGVIYLSIPVLTGINPGRTGLGPRDFAEALVNPGINKSTRVIGYTALGISRGGLIEQIGPGVRRAVFLGATFLLLCVVGVIYITLRLTRPLTRLAKLADDAASGRLKEPVEIQASGEIKDIADVLNSVIGGFSSYRQELNVGQQLLSQKVDERTTQLSQRDEELTRAEQEISETRTKLEHLAYYDSLTSLPNRSLFTEQLDLLLGLNQRNGHTLALLYLDLDNFKRINDSLGYSAGDDLLREVGRRLTECLRDSDRVAHIVDSGREIDVSRLGGDEFTVVLNQLDSIESAGLVAQRLIKSLVQPMMIEGHEVVVKPRIGIAVSPRDGSDVEGLLKASGIALQHAKASTREDCLYFQADMQAIGAGRLQLEADLRKAIERKQLVLHYQPQVNTLTGSVVGAEALLRWEHPEFGQVPPHQFIALAEDVGLMRELGDWVLVEVLRQLQEFDTQGVNLPRIAINVSAMQFDRDFVKRIEVELKRAKLEPARLELGLTESIMMGTDSGTRESLWMLREMGVHLSLDDFGTSHYPLTYLSRYGLDELRIDRSFMIDFEKNANGARLVTGIIALAAKLELQVVAEGVETEQHYRFLTSNGAHVLQGYLFSKAVPAAELKPMLAPWHFMQQIQQIAV